MGAKILMIEDDLNILANNRDFLTKEGFTVMCASTLARGRNYLEDAPDLILLDVMLPDGLGFNMVAEIRAKTSAPIIFLSSRNENESVIKGLNSGGDDYITKPYDLNVLLARIQSALRRVGLDEEVIRVPPLTIDLLSSTAELNGEKINLSQRELQLLAFLAKNAGRCVKCEDIYRRVWGEPVPGFKRTISVYVTYLRRKLKLSQNGLFEIRSVGGQEYILSKTVY